MSELLNCTNLNIITDIMGSNFSVYFKIYTSLSIYEARKRSEDSDDTLSVSRFKQQMISTQEILSTSPEKFG